MDTDTDRPEYRALIAEFEGSSTAPTPSRPRSSTTSPRSTR